ncbi:MAG: SDR family NAD(P)-dependent oxidoreductase [Vallitalea sp.]|jgi:short-subunit dehydrogenase|nr:SDR family NAD(P)-dependent oxidoreductase [Vallitalea sp.]
MNKKIAIVTGASSGLGKEFVKQICLSKSYKFDEIWIIARRTNRLEQIKRTFKNQKFRLLTLDLSKKECLLEYANLLEQEKPNVKLLINNAGLGKIGKFSDIKIEDNINMIDVNIKALTYLTQETLNYMNKSSNIIQLASVAAFLPQPNFTVYAATKSYVLNFTRALNREVKRRGISVTAVCPGPIETEFFKVASDSGLPKSFKKFFFTPANKVVARALHDSRRGKEISMYGMSMKGLRILAKILPHRVILKFIK